jgi:hypothetical protein
MPIINMNDMMGFYPQQTVFVATHDHVSAVTLLNHFTRYTIPTNGVAQVSADTGGQRLYVLDAEASPGLHRLRAVDVSTGAEGAAETGISGVAPAARHALAVATDGRVLVLKSDATHAWVDAYAPVILGSLGVVMEKPGCGDRLLVSAFGTAIVCLSSGEIAIDDQHGNHTAIQGAMPDLVGAAIAHDGALYVVTADQQLGRVRAGTTALETRAWPNEWQGTVLADGLAVAQGGASLVLAQLSGEVAWLRVSATNSSMTPRMAFRLAGVPQGGILALWPFAYYTVDSTVRHVDLTSGLLETMAEIGPAAIPAAVVNG